MFKPSVLKNSVLFRVVGCVILAIFANLAACKREVPIPLEADDALEYAIFEFLVSRFVSGTPLPLSADIPVYVSKGRMDAPQDVEVAVLQKLRRLWPIRNVSEAQLPELPRTSVLDPKTGMQGVLLWCEEVTMDSDHTKVECGMYSSGTIAESLELELVRDGEGWRVTGERITGVS